MEQRVLGAGGPSLSVVGLGCNNFGMRIDAAETDRVVRAALDAGINHFDTAESYGGGKSEEFLGAALGSRRDEAVIATKYTRRPADVSYSPGTMAARIRASAETSLRRLGTDRIDLYYQHFPDPDAPLDEVLEALDGLVREGKVVHIASSNSSAAQMGEAEEISGRRGLARFCGVQIEWSLLVRAVEQEVVPAATRLKMGVVPYFPLTSGLLTGKYRRGEPFPEGTRMAFNDYFASMATDERFDKIESYASYAADHGHSMTELAIGWLVSQPSVTSVIAGATKEDQIAANVAAANWVLTPQQVAEVAAL